MLKEAQAVKGPTVDRPVNSRTIYMSGTAKVEVPLHAEGFAFGGRDGKTIPEVVGEYAERRALELIEQFHCIPTRIVINLQQEDES